MKSREIGNINEALLVLKHFIDLSAKLLPFLYELENRRILSQEDRQNRDKIKEVYEGNTIDPTTSELLINSNVLALIKDSFQSILSDRRHQKIASLKSFLSEYDRLKQEWQYIESN